MTLIICFVYGSIYAQDLGKKVEESYELEQAYSRVQMNGTGDVFLHIADDYRIEVVCYENLLELIEVEVSGDLLKIRTNFEKQMYKGVTDVEFHVYAPGYNEISHKGVGDVICKESIKSDVLNVKLVGVGDIELLDLDVNNLEVLQKGVGKIKLKGSSINADYMLKDVGNINAFDLKAVNCSAYSSGVGNIRLYASKTLSAQAKGVGNIYYRGDPKDVNEKSGITGQVKKG